MKCQHQDRQQSRRTCLADFYCGYLSSPAKPVRLRVHVVLSQVLQARCTAYWSQKLLTAVRTTCSWAARADIAAGAVLRNHATENPVQGI